MHIQNQLEIEKLPTDNQFKINGICRCGLIADLNNLLEKH